MLKRVNNWLHLWLGLFSGVVVLVVCITGCIWVFNEEITSLLEPETKMAYQQKPVLTPSALLKVARKEHPDMVPFYANYRQGRAINLALRKAGKLNRRGGGVLLKINPYTGGIVSRQVSKKGQTDFFRFILDGHRALWLPYNIGRPIIDYATLVFVLLLITGLVWWYPKKWNKSTRSKSFKIKWGASFKRVNLDLHNVLGFYAMLFLLAIALTGMVIGLRWFNNGVYWITTGEKMKDFRRFTSDSLHRATATEPGKAMDLLWQKVLDENPQSMGFYYTFPDRANAKSAVDIIVYPTAGQFYRSKSYTFDQYTLKPINRKDPYAISYEEASVGQKLRKMNYDIHVGSVLGLPGKIMAFLASLIGASLPITGFLVWWGKRNKKSDKPREIRLGKVDKELIKEVKLKTQKVPVSNVG